MPSEEEDEGLEPCQSESYHWCEEDDLTSSEAVTSTSTEKTLASSAEADQHHSAEEYVELAKEADTNLAHIDMEDFQSEQIRSLLIEYRQRNSRPLSRSQSPLSQVPMLRIGRTQYEGQGQQQELRSAHLFYLWNL